MTKFKHRSEPPLSEALSPERTLSFFPPSVDAPGAAGPDPYGYFEGCSGVPFEHGAQNYSRNNAWLLSDLSFLVYTASSTPSETSELLRPILARVFDPATLVVAVFHGEVPILGTKVIDNMVQCVVARDATKGVVAFRGTVPTSLGNWLTDAKFQQVDEPGPERLRVHLGFKDAVDSVWPDVSAYLTEIRNPSPAFRWWFAGHSLGAALATVAVRRFGRAHAIYTFGSPRVGNSAFARSVVRSVHGRCYRIVNHEDIVTQLPPTSLDDWSHAGHVKYFEDNDRTRSLLERAVLTARHLFGHPPLMDKATHALFHAAGYLKEEYHDRVPLRKFVDHSPVFYSKLLWNDLVRASKIRDHDRSPAPRSGIGRGEIRSGA